MAMPVDAPFDWPCSTYRVMTRATPAGMNACTGMSKYPPANEDGTVKGGPSETIVPSSSRTWVRMVGDAGEPSLARSNGAMA